MKKKGKEISVKIAAQKLNLTERTILNFIKQKKLEAIKVGRDWFIDYASFVSFALKYDIPISEKSDGFSEKFGNLPKDSEKNADFSEISERFDVSSKTFPKDSEKMEVLSEKPNLKRANHITSLRVYELSKHIFSNHNFQFNPENKIEERLIELSLQTLERIGSGFYAYSWDEKKVYYARARSSAGALMALISSRGPVLQKWHKEGHELEEVLIPALGALIKIIEKKSNKEKYEGRDSRETRSTR